MRYLHVNKIGLLFIMSLSPSASSLDVPTLQSDLTDSGNIRESNWVGVSVRGLIIGPASPNGDFLHDEEIIQKWEDLDSRWLLTIVGKNEIIFKGNGHFGINYYFSDAIGAQIICVMDYLIPETAIVPFKVPIVVALKRGVDDVYIPMSREELLRNQE